VDRYGCRNVDNCSWRTSMEDCITMEPATRGGNSP
jgi:hypothetical protein